MRYLGNKETLKKEIREMLSSHKLLKENLVFFDAFSGTGSVSDSLKDIYNLVINDNLKFASIFSYGRIVKDKVLFKDLGFNPIDFFNNNSNTIEGFFFKNYAPKLSGRMYFSDFNAARIDYFRNTIEEWKNDKKINEIEYSYLLACLFESISKVANVAGVYGAYLKTWDPRATKEIKFLQVESENKNSRNVKAYNANLKEIIKDVDCDILYLDPPYTKNKYTVQYHILETLALNDNPKLHGITGTRKFPLVSNAWSEKYTVDVEFDYIIANTKAKYVMMSYSSDGLMSKDYILNVLKRYCELDTIECKEIVYKKYRNFKTFTTNTHFEYLFFGKKKDAKDINYYCPLNYMGGKSTIIEFIKKSIKVQKNHSFIDLMAGGFNVGINMSGFTKYVYNDINFILKNLICMFQKEDTAKLLKFIDKTIEENLLTKHGKENYLKFRLKFNNDYRKKNGWEKYLFVLILYGFQQQLRFNSNYEFNNPVGESGYSENIKEKIVSFSRRIKEINVFFESKDYEELLSEIDENTCLYVDPPYLITLGSYNDGKRGFKGWNNAEEVRLLTFLEKAKSKGCDIYLSNVLDYKNKSNDLLKSWIRKNNAKFDIINFRNREEALIIL